MLVIDVILIWFSDKMPFILTTLKNLENGIWCSKEYKKAQLTQRERATAVHV